MVKIKGAWKPWHTRGLTLLKKLRIFDMERDNMQLGEERRGGDMVYGREPETKYS